jgi:hypothetical protein
MQGSNLPKQIKNYNLSKKNKNMSADTLVSPPENRPINGDFDYWVEAVKFSEELVVSDIEDKFVAYVKGKEFNHSEILLFRKLLADAIEMSFMVGQLKHCH